MNDTSEPQWDLLPDHPLEFFSLSGEFDIRDLKRSYNALIRQYKPEKFPNEFQIIRAAYEKLHDALRYQESLGNESDQPEFIFDWTLTPQTEPGNQKGDGLAEVNPSPGTSIDQRQNNKAIAKQTESPLHERIDNESLEHHYQVLQAKETKTPYDYYTLAVISDLLQKEELSFADWLLEGLKKHTEEPGLFDLLRQFLAAEHSPEQIIRLLKATSYVIRSDRFYYLTEKAWDNLIRTTSFNAFRETLASCEGNMRDDQIDHKLVFYLHILKPAMWTAYSSWIDKALALIEDHFHDMPFWVEEELYYLNCIHIYRKQRSQFLIRGKIRVMIDQAITDYFTKSEIEAQHGFLEFQQLLMMHEKELQSEFNAYEESLLMLQIIWEKIADDVYDALGDQRVLNQSNSFDQRIERLASQLVRNGITPDTKMMTGIFGVSIVNMSIINMMVFIHIFLFGENSTWFKGIELTGLILFDLTAAFLISIAWKYTNYNFSPDWWRQELKLYYQTASDPLIEVTNALEQISYISIKGENYKGFSNIANLIRSDLSLFFYVTAQRLSNICQ
ncbi:hypothetical protein [uncultured Gimesia sp.]|uniref:hypothetical protein n=1 Tax=uncultured Gimesia sp. TaxID=1678688 RepID=UPI00261935F1|nr:hypothetical protein [uncultured Gimesia sp.]